MSDAMREDVAESAPSRRALASLGPFLVTANVRGALDAGRCRVGSGLGRVGDLVIGEVLPEDGRSARILDQDWAVHECRSPVRVVAVLGPRDSSTHVCATIPPEGLSIEKGSMMHWVAGESGIVGCLEREAPAASVHRPESALPFRCDGLLFRGDVHPVNVRDFAVKPSQDRPSRPVVLVGATSSEAGKTVLAGELIRRLTAAGIRVGAIKATGTGGVLDSLSHRQAGAVSVLDNVDAGLISTHCDPGEFRERIPLVFRAMSGGEVDLIVAELGGDLLSANNQTLFDLPEIVERALLLMVLSNDALAAAGVETVNAARLGFPKSRVRHFTSPFRNHAGMRRRMAAAGIRQCYDPRSPGAMEEIVRETMQALSRAGILVSE
jgi:hypothetical protein